MGDLAQAPPRSATIGPAKVTDLRMPAMLQHYTRLRAEEVAPMLD